MFPRKGWPLKQGFTDFSKRQQEPNEESVVSPTYIPPRKRKADKFCVVRCAVPPSAASPGALRFSDRSAHLKRGVPLPQGFTVRRPPPVVAHRSAAATARADVHGFCDVQGTRSRRIEMCATCHCRTYEKCTVGPENEPCANCMDGHRHRQSYEMDLVIDNPCYDVRPRPKRTKTGAGAYS